MPAKTATAPFNPVFIRGKKCTLRPMLEADMPLMVKWFNDPDVRPFILAYFPQDEASERTWIRRAYKGRTTLPLVMVDLKGQPFGTMGLTRIDLKNRNALTGALIGEKAYWGKGYGTDAKLHLLQYAFEELGLHRVGSHVHSFNERSVRYSLRCGYKVEGRLKETLFRYGKFWDTIQMVVFRKDWERVWEKYQKTGKVR